MTVGEAFLSAFLQVLFDRLVPRDWLTYFQTDDDGVLSELNKWKTTLLKIQLVLSDAEKKQLENTAVKIWLDDLRNVAYDMEDVLDVFATEAFKRQSMNENRKDFVNCEVKAEIESITTRLQELCDQGIELSWEKIVAGPSSTAEWQRPPSTCVPTETKVYGRDEDKARIIELLKDEAAGRDANVHVISIVGMGGIGKTKIAQQIYNDVAIESCQFEMKAWVCVSDDFDVFRVSKAILESIALESIDLKDLNSLQLKLQEKVSQKKFLLVLDDVWKMNHGMWETLKSPLKAGARGSNIIVTTRNVDVALTMGSTGNYNLKLLNDEDCWLVFMHAMEGRYNEDQQNLELIRDKVVKKCKGLPLAAKSLGGLLRCKHRNEGWEHALISRAWDLSDYSEILYVLKLSYDHLPSHLKRCFAYCAILPKGYKFEEKELVLLWMAEGLIQPSKNNKQLEELGSEYFDDLLSRSIFQKSDNCKFVMHDLINDLAQWVMGETSFKLDDESEANVESKKLHRARHSSYNCYHACDCGHFGSKKFKTFSEADQIRTFLPILRAEQSCFMSNMALTELVSKLKKLRVLSLERYCIRMLPDTLNNLIHLRYLNLSHTQIRSLPDFTKSLLNLQILILRNCISLTELPSDMGNLINLRHLDIEGTKLKRMPLGMENLISLQRLSDFVVGEDINSGSSLKDLKNLKFLCGELCISSLENVANSRDIGETILSDKKNLKVLTLEWKSIFDDSRNGVEEKNVLEMLRPHRNIEGLTINYYGGEKFPSWIGNPSLCNVVVLSLVGCEKCTSLPSLGLLSLLKDLKIKRMKGLRRIAFEIYGKDYSMPFQSLETLSLEELPEWEQWIPSKENDHVNKFPCLRELFIRNCEKLRGILPDHLPSLQKLVICQCKQLEVSYSNLPMLCDIEVDGCQSMKCGASTTDSKTLKFVKLSSIAMSGNWLQQNFDSVARLKIEHLKEPTQGLHMFTSLKDLYIENCPIVSIPEGCFHSILSTLEIKNCKILASLLVGMEYKNIGLQILVVEGCHSLLSIVKGQLPSSLKRLEIKNCEKLTFLLDDEEDPCTSSSSDSRIQEGNADSISTSLLEYLHISGCSSLICLLSRGQLPDSLVHLEIEDCLNFSSLSQSGGCFPRALEHFKMKNCPKVETLSFGGLPLPEALQQLEVQDCSNLRNLSEGDLTKQLKHLKVQRCSQLTALSPGGQLPESLKYLEIDSCENLQSIPESTMPLASLQGCGHPNLSLTVFSIKYCDKIIALPNFFHNFNSLQKLEILGCSNISFPDEGFPTNLFSLSVEGLNMYKSLIEWGSYKLTSLKELRIAKCPNVKSFPVDGEEMRMMLPVSLTHLKIDQFQDLEFLSAEGFERLTSLEKLSISLCQKLDFCEDEHLPSSLLQLYINDCPVLEEKCISGRGTVRKMIDHIPLIMIDDIFLEDSRAKKDRCRSWFSYK